NTSKSLDKVKTMVLGDSRIMTAVNPQLIPNSINIAENSESYFISYFKLKRLLNQKNELKTIIIGFSYPSFSAYMDRLFDGDMATGDILNRIYPIVSISDFKNFDLDVDKYRQVYFKNMFVYPHLDHNKFIGSFTPLKPGIENTNIESTLKRHYYRQDSIFVGISDLNRNYLDSIIELTRKENIDLVLVNIPLHKDYLEKIPQPIVDYYEKTKAELLNKRVKILDYGQLKFENNCFKDHNHLSIIGANRITRQIKKELELY
ncbi:MAG: hypothetical protein KJ941_08625, partial [Bacteroidetes bacterium]|nr:hypothetical protein [Bacteroidota bacterium]